MNTPILMQSEEKRAPWNQDVKYVQVDISVSMSATYEVELPIDADENDPNVLKDAVLNQIYLPQDLIEDKILSEKWIIDDFVVC